VYEDADGTWVYRASSVGQCERALLHARIGRAVSPRSEKLGAAMAASARLEGPIADALAEQYQIVVTDSQTEVEVPVSPGVVIRGHIDGFGTTEHRSGLVEIKAFGEGFWNEWRKGGIQAFPTYVAQFHLYCAGLVSSGLPDLKGGWFVVGKKGETGHLESHLEGRPQVRYEWVDFKPAVVAKMVARVKRVEAAYVRMQEGERADEELDCPGAFGCPYWTLHDPDDRPVEVHVDLNDLIHRYGVHKVTQETAKMQMDMIRGKVEAILEAEGVTSKRVLMGPEQAATVTMVPESTSTTWDWKKAEADGVEMPTRYWKVNTRKGYVKITPPPTEKT
jgi:hypothetical protein